MEKIAGEKHEEFARAEPYPHIVIEDFLSLEAAEGVLPEFDINAEGWNHYHHFNERKLALTDINRMGPNTRKVFEAIQSQAFIDAMSKLTGVDGLINDPELDGAGMHQIKRGGFLNVHTDYLTHTSKRQWSRQLNLLIYFNKDWDEAWGGQLELWDSEMKGCVRSIAPAFNRAVIFRTIEGSFHGHPDPLTCPAERSRKSIAFYLFRDEGKARPLQPTNYRPRPEDSMPKRAMIAVDRGMLRAYSIAKRYANLKDGIIDRIMKHF